MGSRQPELTYTVDGLVGTDTLTTAPTLSTDANMYKTMVIAAADMILTPSFNLNYRSLIRNNSQLVVISLMILYILI